MEFQDRELECIDCKQQFLFTAGEQEFYDRKGFKEIPKRCKTCRENRKTKRNGPGTGAMASGGESAGGNSRGGYGAGGGGGYGGGGGGSYGGGNSSGGNSDSYGNSGNSIGGGYGGGNRSASGGGARGYSGGGGGAPGGGGQREMFDAVCAACGAQARVPFKPVAGRPVYCRDCFANRSAG